MQPSPVRVAVALELTWNLKRHTDVFAGVARYAEERPDWQCVIDDFAAETIRRSPSQERVYDGIIARVTPELAELAAERKVPFVNVWYSSPVRDVPAVTSDYEAAGELLADHMLGRGISRLLCLIREDAIAERVAAARIERLARDQGGACETVRLPIMFAHSHADWLQLRTAILDWLKRTPTPAGVVTIVDMIARHTAQLCAEVGLRVPEDIAIAGGDNEPTICLYPAPTLTSIEYGLDRVGYEAARMLQQLLDAQQLQQRIVKIPPQKLIVRQSSDFLYVDEEIVSLAVQFIAQNAHRPIGVHEVAAAVGAARRTLELRFQKHLGRSVAAEIRRVRLDQAKRLLASSTEPIAQIARLTGIGTPQQFARVFRREVGISPTDYREQFADSG